MKCLQVPVLASTASPFSEQEDLLKCKSNYFAQPERKTGKNGCCGHPNNMDDYEDSQAVVRPARGYCEGQSLGQKREDCAITQPAE